MVGEGANGRALFTGFRNLVIEQFENESWLGVSRGDFWEISKGTYRPAGLLSTEMSTNVRFLAMVTAYGQLSCHTVDDSDRVVQRLSYRHRARSRGCDLREGGRV